MKTYTVSTLESDVNQKTITISETKTVEQTSEVKTTIATLLENHTAALVKRDAAIAEANAIVDRLTDIEENTDLEVADKPLKI